MNEGKRRFISEAARKIIEESVLFVIGSGLSLNWNMPSAGDLAGWLRERYEKCKSRDGISSADDDLLHVLVQQHSDGPPLDLMADALAVNKCWFLRELFYAPDDPPRLQHGRLCQPAEGGSNFFRSASWLSGGEPVADGRIGLPHIVIGRWAKEGLIQEILTTNYDSLIEAGCIAVGMREWPNPDNESPGQDLTRDAIPWRQAFRVVRSSTEFSRLVPRNNVFHIYKIHGCNDALRKRFPDNETTQPNSDAAGTPATVRDDHCTHGCSSCTQTTHISECKLIPEEFTFVITRRELLDWRHDHWARDLFQDRARSHHLTLVGFGGEDMVLHASLQSVYAEAVNPQASVPTREPLSDSKRENFRLQAVALEPNIHLQQLLRSGLEENEKPAGMPPPQQFYALGSEDPKEAVEKLFRNLYVESMQRLFQRKLKIGGTAWLERIVVRQNKWISESPNVPELHQWLQSGLAPRFLPEEVWFYTLPKLVMLSWLLNEPLQATAGEAYLSRLRRPHFYVPMGMNEELFYPLFTFVVALQRLANEGEKLSGRTMDSVIWHDGGWIEVTFHRRTGPRKHVQPDAIRRLLILPIVAPSEAHTVRQPSLPRQVIQPPSRAARWPGTVTVVLYLQEDGRAKLLSGPRGAVRHVLGSPENLHFYLPYEGMLDSVKFQEALGELIDSPIETEQPKPAEVSVWAT